MSVFNHLLGRFRRKLGPGGIGIAVFLILIGLTGYFSFERYRLTALSEAGRAHELIDAGKTRMLEAFGYSVSATELLGYLVKEYHIEDHFDSVASEIFKTKKYIDAIELVPNGVICCVYPLEGNKEAIGYNILEDKNRNVEALEAIARNELYFAGPLELRQGGMAIVGRLPIFIEGKFWGFSAVIIKLETLEEVIGINNSNSDFELNLAKINPDSKLADVETSPNKSRTFSTEVIIHNGEWRLSAISKDKNKAWRETLPILLFGLLLSITGAAFARTMASTPALLEKKLSERSQSLTASEAKYLDLFDNSPTMLMSVDLKTLKIIDCNNAFRQAVGYNREEIWHKTMPEFYHPSCQQAIEEIKEEFNRTEKVNSRELKVIKKNGDLMYVLLSSTAVKDERGNIVYSRSSWQDITEKKLAEVLLESERKVLEMIAKGESKTEILNRIASNYESYSPGTFCSILLLSGDGLRVKFGAGPSLPQAFNQSIDGLEIGPNAGSCGSAAFRKERVIVSDIENDPLWADYKGLALPHGLRACWSTPVISGSGQVLGTFAIYYTEKKSPSEKELELIERSSNQVKIALEKHLSEELIRANEEKFALAFESNVLGLAITDQERRIIEINPSLAKLFGKSPEQMIGRVASDVGIDDVEFLNSPEGTIQDKLKESGEIRNEEAVIQLNSGNLLYVLLSISPINLNGKHHWLTTISDITEKKKTQDALEKSEMHLRTIIETEPECIKQMDSSGHLLEMNAAGLRMIEADSIEQVRGKILHSLIQPEYRDKFISLTKDVFRGKSGSLQFKITSLKGNERWLETNAVPLPGLNGEISIMLGITRDITEQKLSDKALQESMDRNKAFLNGIPDLMIVLNDDGVFVDYQAPEGVKTYAPAESFLGKRIEQVMPHNLAVEIRSCLKRALDSGQLQVHAYQLPMKVDEIRSFEARYVKINPKEVLVIIRDVTELKKAEEELLRSKEALEQAEGYANLGNWELEVGSQKSRWSKQMFRMFGFDPESGVPSFEAYLNHIHPEDRGIIADTLNRMVSGKEPLIQTFRTNPEILPARFFRPTYMLVKDGLGKPIKFSGTVMDITSLVLREEALKTSEKKYRTVFENTTEGIYRSTIEGKLLLANPSFVSIFGYLTQDEMMNSVNDIGENMYFSREDREQFLSEILLKGHVNKMEVHGKRKNGEIIWISLNSHVVYNESKSIEYIEGTITDITERKLSRFKIEEQYSALRKYAFINSHQVRAHVATILGLSNLFKNKGVTREEEENIVALLQLETAELDKLIRKLSVIINDVN